MGIYLCSFNVNGEFIIYHRAIHVGKPGIRLATDGSRHVLGQNKSHDAASIVSRAHWDNVGTHRWYASILE